jgi:hypothetical protein
MRTVEDGHFAGRKPAVWAEALPASTHAARAVETTIQRARAIVRSTDVKVAPRYRGPRPTFGSICPPKGCVYGRSPRYDGLTETIADAAFENVTPRIPEILKNCREPGGSDAIAFPV